MGLPLQSRTRKRAYTAPKIKSPLLIVGEIERQTSNGRASGGGRHRSGLPERVAPPVGGAEIRHIMSKKANRCNIISDASGSRATFAIGGACPVSPEPPPSPLRTAARAGVHGADRDRAGER